MDQYLSSVVVALITGVISIITLIIQKRSDKVINKIDEQTMFIEREKEIKYRLNQKQKEKESIIHEMMILIMDTNLFIMGDLYIDGNNSTLINDASERSKDLKERFNKVCDEIEDIQREYEMLLDMTSDIQREIQRINTT